MTTIENEKNRTVLHYAAIGGFRALVEKILSQQENLNVLPFTKDTVSFITVSKKSAPKSFNNIKLLI